MDGHLQGAEPGQKKGRKGYRKVETMDRMLLYLIRMRHGWPFFMLGVFFGISDESASCYVDEVMRCMVEDFVPRLFYFPTKSEVDPHISKEFKRDFPGVMFIGDGTHLHTGTPENYALNGLSFCVYKWSSTLQFVARIFF